MAKASDGSRAPEQTGRKRPLWLTAIAAFALGYVALCLLLWAFQRRMIYFPGPALPAPGAVGLPEAEAVTLRTEDGLELIAWYVPAQGARYTAVAFHGNAGTIADRAHLAQILNEAGCSALMVEYRGYGGNPGAPSEQGLYRDARAALAFLESRADVDTSRLVYFGKSLGTGPAAHLAHEHTPAALVLDSPFTSMPDAAARHYPYLPARRLVKDRYDTLSKMGRITCPVLVIAGEQDRIVPPHLSRQVYEEANEPKELLLVPGAGHNDLLAVASVEYVAAVRRLIDRAETGRAEHREAESTPR
jgi:fermentation-respiration switch protein FrsA (DUF1100 family)